MNAENFTRLGIKERLQHALVDMNITKPTEIQERLIPAILNKKDVIGQSQTGTGKTFAFLLPIIEQLDLTNQSVQAIITAPTRELCSQLFDELKKLIVHYENEVDAQLFVGGTDRQKQIQKLGQAQPHIIIGTPGRIKDLIQNQALHPHTATTFVVDETDQMLDMGFIEEVDGIASSMADDLQMLVFSATVPENLQPFLRKYMNNPRHVHVQPEKLAAEKVTHQLIPVRHKEKMTVLKETVAGITPYLAIIFANTKEQVDQIADELAGEGLLIDRLHGGLPPRERKKVMKKVEDLSVQFLVATDLAARGIDIKGVTHIINYEFPDDLDFYIHRVGRTARLGLDGKALSLYELSDEAACAKLVKRGIRFTFVERKQGEWIEVKAPLGAARMKQKQEKPEGQINLLENKQNKKNRTGGKAKAKPKKVKPAYRRKARTANEKRQRRDSKARSKKNK
ncbi:LOW QUALITY PROTEIN: ATP-dependent RNA helicase YqfR [Bacillus sp. JCM 19046]|nr:LOW QUALITY PROTEIN: ATP-dependent RNA helicase YqfR [Bacillus sp. JCM 19046]